MKLYEIFRKSQFDPYLYSLKLLSNSDTNYDLLKGCVCLVTFGPPCILYTNNSKFIKQINISIRSWIFFKDFWRIPRKVSNLCHY